MRPRVSGSGGGGRFAACLLSPLLRAAQAMLATMVSSATDPGEVMISSSEIPCLCLTVMLQSKGLGARVGLRGAGVSRGRLTRSWY